MIAAPFYGEFGWEVALWAPFLRARSKHDEVEVICRPGHGFLYEDFAKSILEAPPPSGITKVDCQNVWLHGALFKEASMLDFVRKITRAKTSQKTSQKSLIEVSAMPINWDAGPPAIKPLWHKPELLVEAKKEPGWIAIHARNSSRNPQRNWGLLNWLELTNELPTEHVIVVGRADESFRVNGDFEDLRDRPLEEVCGALARCQLIVGPSSGPMPLAAYCGTPSVWWSPNAKDLVRYMSACWNPLGVSNSRVDDSWDPDPIAVMRAVHEMIEDTE